MMADGCTLAEVGRRFGVHRDTVRRFCLWQGIPMQRGGRNLNVDLRAQIMALLAAGVDTRRKLGEVVGRSRTVLMGHLTELERIGAVRRTGRTCSTRFFPTKSWVMSGSKG